MVPLAERPEEPVVGGADSDSSLQQETNWLFHLGDDQVHRRRHVHELVFGGERERKRVEEEETSLSSNIQEILTILGRILWTIPALILHSN